MENNIKSINETIICINNNEKIFLSQDLKNQEVELSELDNIANGQIRTNTFINTYLKEYENTKFNKEKERMLFINPSIEKISKDELLIDILLFIVKISSEKQIFLLNKFSPKVLIDSEILKIKSKNSDNKKYEQFIQIPHIINFIKKL